MPETIDWQNVADPDHAILAAVEHLRAGRIVMLPTETGYVLAAKERSPEASAGLPWSAALSTETVVRDWLPKLQPTPRRLARRLWPGPVVLAFAEPVPDGPPASEGLHVRCPAHEVVREVLRLVPEALFLADAPIPGTAVLDERVVLVIDDGPVRYAQGPTFVRVSGDSVEVVREGAVPASLVERQTACLIVFVCTGNTCRSPMAEALCKKRLSERLGCPPDELPKRGYVVLSAGLLAYSGGTAAAEAIKAAATYGGDLSAHRSRAMTAEMLYQADFVVGMTQDHVEALTEAAAGLAAPPRLLSPAGEDLLDPVGQDFSVYEDCAAAIWKHLEALTEEIVATSPPRPAKR